MIRLSSCNRFCICRKPRQLSSLHYSDSQNNRNETPIPATGSITSQFDNPMIEVVKLGISH